MKLKKCPCGGVVYHTEAVGEHWITCEDCDASTAMCPSEDKAWELWDNRADQPAVLPREERPCV